MVLNQGHTYAKAKQGKVKSLIIIPVFEFGYEELSMR